MKFLHGDAEWASSIDMRKPMSRSAFFAKFFSHYTIPLYLLGALACLVTAITLVDSWWQIAGSFALVAVAYPLVEFLLHRFVLHGPLYRMHWTAALWRRLHYVHHMDPNDLSVLFGAPYTTIPAVLATAAPLGYLAFGLPGMAAASAAGFFALVIYEFHHAAAHLPVTFKSRLLAHMRRHHLLHHFHSERGNYGIVTDIADRAIGTIYEGAGGAGKSPTVRNLGYTDEQARKYPWVAELGDETR